MMEAKEVGFRHRVSQQSHSEACATLCGRGVGAPRQGEAHPPLGWKGPPGAFLTSTTAPCVKGSMSGVQRC